MNQEWRNGDGRSHFSRSCSSVCCVASLILSYRSLERSRVPSNNVSSRSWINLEHSTVTFQRRNRAMTSRTCARLRTFLGWLGELRREQRVDLQVRQWQEASVAKTCRHLQASFAAGPSRATSYPVGTNFHNIIEIESSGSNFCKSKQSNLVQHDRLNVVTEHVSKTLHQTRFAATLIENHINFLKK